MPHAYLAATRPDRDALDLLATYGTAAAATVEAQLLAERSRRLGNHLQVCRWRQVARLIGALGADGADGTLH